MADIITNLELRQVRLKVKIAEMQLNLQRMDLRKMELDDEKRHIDENIIATHKTIQDLQKELIIGEK